MDAAAVSILLPGVEIRLHIDALEPVPGDDVEFPDGIIILRGVACRHHDPALRHPMAAEDLVLQKLQHSRCQGLGHAVDLVEKENALPDIGLLHAVINGGNDLRHGVFGHIILCSAVILPDDKRQTQGALAGVMGHGIADDADAQFLGDLLHDGGLADARRAHEEHRPLPLQRDFVFSVDVFGQIGGDGILDLVLRFFDVHTYPPKSIHMAGRMAYSALSAR